jgi:hypothetical protein
MVLFLGEIMWLRGSMRHFTGLTPEFRNLSRACGAAIFDLTLLAQKTERRQRAP